MTSEGFAAAKHLPGNVRRLRDHKGLSREGLADEMAALGHKWYPNTIARIEAGKQGAGVEEAIDLAAILGVPLERLFWAGPEETETALAEQAGVNLRRAHADAAGAMDRLRAAVRAAENIADSAGRSRYEHPRQAAAELALDLRDLTPDSAFGAGGEMPGREAGA